MRRQFFLGMLVVVALIWGPMWMWDHLKVEGQIANSALRLSMIAGVALGGYLLWTIVMRALLGHDDEK